MTYLLSYNPIQKLLKITESDEVLLGAATEAESTTDIESMVDAEYKTVANPGLTVKLEDIEEWESRLCKEDRYHTRTVMQPSVGDRCFVCKRLQRVKL